MKPRTLLLGASISLLLACASDDKKPQDQRDGAPGGTLDPSQVKDAVPQPEEKSRYGNKPVYEVWGKTYTVMNDASGYKATGTASWYGTKFHGRPTSSGEPFDMYKATAAHRSLPLPTYARVTNLDNGKSVIVKVNDRGPFHSERLIDLSYGAAVKIGIAQQGTGRVEIETITFDQAAPDRRLPDKTFLQAGAFKSRSTAKELADTLERRNIDDVEVDKGGGWYRVYIGPFASTATLAAVADRVVELGYDRPHKVRR